MAYQSLYRRYRPGRFGEVRGQEPIVRALRNAVREGRVGHAYLFSGPRGTGKTSTARILAKVLNCADPVDGEPCCKCDSCLAIDAGSSLDVFELDAASNNGVDAIRDLVEKSALGSPGRTKLYILDEVHMLSKAASNALLKTLEEPPQHVVFVLATTDPHKVLPTIRSRTQHYEFQLLPADELADHVRYVIADAGLDLPAEAVEHAVRRGAGSARDTLSALDQVAASGVVSDDRSPVLEAVEALCDADAGRALVAVATACSQGRDPNDLAESLLAHLRNAFLSAMAPNLVQVTDLDREQVAAHAERLRPAGVVRALEMLGEAMVDMRQAPDPRIPLEVALVRLARPDSDVSLDALVDRMNRLERALAERPDPAPTAAGTPPPRAPRPPAAPSANADAGVAGARAALRTEQTPPETAPAAAGKRAPESKPADKTTAKPAEKPQAGAGPAAADLPDRDTLTLAWGDRILETLPQRAKARYRAGRFLEVADGAAVFAVPNPIHRDRCEEVRTEVETALAAHFGRAVPLRVVVDANEGPAPARPGPDDEVVDVSELRDAPAGVPSGVDRLAEAFPGAELVEEE